MRTRDALTCSLISGVQRVAMGSPARFTTPVAPCAAHASVVSCVCTHHMASAHSSTRACFQPWWLSVWRACSGTHAHSVLCTCLDAARPPACVGFLVCSKECFRLLLGQPGGQALSWQQQKWRQWTEPERGCRLLCEQGSYWTCVWPDIADYVLVDNVSGTNQSALRAQAGSESIIVCSAT